MSVEKLTKALKSFGSAEKAFFLSRFFKTGPGEYSQGDCFLGVKVPLIRQTAKAYLNLNETQIEELLASKWHEVRLCALIILMNQVEKKIISQCTAYSIYCNNISAVNNWDLVDLSAPKLVGEYLQRRPQKDRRILLDFAHQPSLWIRRIAILATFPQIKVGEYERILEISRHLLSDKHDLIHKACGWMLREVGKKDLPIMLEFIESHGSQMPRTMLRYAIERLPEKQRKSILVSTRLKHR